MSDLITINTNGLDEAIRCAICENPIKSERGCDGSCQYDKEMLSKVIDTVKGLAVERPHGTCKTCKNYNPYEYRGDGYCKSTITNSEGQAYINCHDEWYCANYEKEGEKE